ncbi:unnamed protein product [Effrenium voratum]|uniref:Uncharacterized protein n=1 Tax=Effrenium voratum TaxID=2562239 RepID=A0AA36HSV3_9DINO|nr:unnamed protein product [Effrenium voratum]
MLGNQDLAGTKFFKAPDTSDSPDADSESELEPAEALQRLLADIAPCVTAYPAALAQSTERQRVDGKPDRWTPLKGQQLVVKPANEEDCVLLVANALVTPESDREESHWLLKRDGASISAPFSSYSRQRSWNHHVCIPWLDQPLKRAELDYQVVATAGRDTSHFVVGEKRERRQLFGVTIPCHQVAWVEDDEVLGLPPGPWVDVNGLHEVITTLPGERVLVLCAMHYVANWSSELNRGRFTLVRDDLGLDGPADRGLQSVRALGPSQPRTMIMATLDEPPPGPHLYRARAALTTGEESGVSLTLTGERQLALVRLPSNLVIGPSRPIEPVEITEGTWTEIPGMCATCTLRRPRNRVLLVYHIDCNPLSFHYEAHFTIFRRKESAVSSDQNLGFSEDFGLDMVFSDYGASSESPVGLLMDTPGSQGPWTYYLAARVANLGTSRENPPVVVGYSGSISAVILPAR